MNQNNQECKYALLVLKPDAFRQILDVNVIQGIEDKGLQIVKRKIVILTPDQAGRLYEEKKGENYFPLLREFMSSGPSLFLILKTDNAVEKSKEYRDWARQNLKLKRFDVTEDDIRLLRQGNHPQQAEITKEMGLENLIHVSNDLKTDIPLLKEIFSKWDLDELREREPELYNLLSCPRDEPEPRRLTHYLPAPEGFLK